jgi:hydroxymethylpyrimidine pyrophosphatase-like HAD family hydrolase
MYFLALATDYDGTIALDSTVDDDTVAALRAFKDTGRKLLLVTGRTIESLRDACPHLKLFDRVVAENGAVIFDPATEQERIIAPEPSPAFIEALRARGVAPLAVGRSIVATWRPHEGAVLEVIQQLGLELHIIFNKKAVMVLPSGVNKATGLCEALKELAISAHNVVGVGDAENDHAFLKACGCRAAVANAVAALKAHADIVLAHDHGAGVAELAELVKTEDSRLVPPQRHGILVGQAADGREAYVEPHVGSVLISGSSGIGKSTLATAFTERMAEHHMEFCVFDPEGDYASLEHSVTKGDATTPPVVEEVLELLRKLNANVVVNTQALNLAERPELFAKLLPQIISLRARTGRPHWLLVDEAHHLVAAARHDVGEILPEMMPATMFITVHPDAMSPHGLRTVEYVIALGPTAADVVATFCKAIGVDPPSPMPALGDEQVLFWARSDGPPVALDVQKPKQKRDRHKRKYAEGHLDPDRSFYFRGPDSKLNLRVDNLALFVQMGEGVDTGTWQFHRERHDYSQWFRDMIKDDELAAEARAAEDDASLDAAASRERIMQAVNRRYTASAEGPRNWREEHARKSPRHAGSAQ